MAEKRGLTLDDLKNNPVENTEENRAAYFDYSEEKLRTVLQEAMDNNEYGIVEFLAAVLKNKTNTNGQLTTTLNDEEELNDKPKEQVSTDGEFVNRYKDQQKAIKRIKQYNDNNQIFEMALKPIDIVIGYDEGGNIKTLVANYRYGPRGYRVINEESGELEEIPEITQKIKENERIKRVSEVGDYWQIEAVRQEEENSLNGIIIHYIVDKNFNEVVELGEENGNGTLTKNKFGCYEYCRDYGEDKKSYTIFNENMEEIASYENIGTYESNEIIKHNITYCDSNICVCNVQGEGQGPYKVFKGNEVIFEGTSYELEEKLKGEEYMEGFFNRARKGEEENNELIRRGSLPFETRYEDKNECMFTYNNSEKTSFSIKNNKGKTLFKLSNVKKDNKISAVFSPDFQTEGGDYVVIENWADESNILAIRFNNERIYINKTTGEKLRTNREKSEMTGNLIKVFYHGNNCKVYDQELKCIGVYEPGAPYRRQPDYETMGFIPVKDVVEGRDTYYIAPIKTGRKLPTQITRIFEDGGMCEPYLHAYKMPEHYDKKGNLEKEKLYLICKIPNENGEGESLAQVEIY